MILSCSGLETSPQYLKMSLYFCNKTWQMKDMLKFQIHFSLTYSRGQERKLVVSAKCTFADLHL